MGVLHRKQKVCMSLSDVSLSASLSISQLTRMSWYPGIQIRDISLQSRGCLKFLHILFLPLELHDCIEGT